MIRIPFPNQPMASFHSSAYSASNHTFSHVRGNHLIYWQWTISNGSSTNRRARLMLNVQQHCSTNPGRRSGPSSEISGSSCHVASCKSMLHWSLQHSRTDIYSHTFNFPLSTIMHLLFMYHSTILTILKLSAVGFNVSICV